MKIDIKHRIFTSDGYKTLTIKEEINEKYIVEIVGQSGIGKTTFFRILSGLLVPDYGVISIGNKVILDTKNKINIPPQRREIALMFQDYALFPNMSVEENIQFAQKKKNILRIEELLKVFDLELFKDKKIQKLSGGQQQRVALARTLAQEARIILLDEPFSAVDKEMRKKMQTEILKYQQEKEAIVFFISHQQDENSNFIANHKIFINFI
jgi:ABC superfamily ATP binding cassette transporter ABC protein